MRVRAYELEVGDIVDVSGLPYLLFKIKDGQFIFAVSDGSSRNEGLRIGIKSQQWVTLLSKSPKKSTPKIEKIIVPST